MSSSGGSPPQDCGPITLAIVDDHAMFGEGLAAALDSRRDVAVVGTATTGSDGFAVVTRVRPDVTLVDHGLPDMAGAAVARRVRVVAPDTKVVMVTSLVDEGIVVAALGAGCSGYVTKDRPVDDVADAVRAAHAGEVVIGPHMLAKVFPRLRASAQRGRSAAQPARAGGPRPRLRGAHERCHRRAVVPHREHGPKPRPEHPVEAPGALEARSGHGRRTRWAGRRDRADAVSP